MKVLLVSDTHGKVGILNRLASEHGCEAVIHAGDFGFSDEESLSRLSDRTSVPDSITILSFKFTTAVSWIPAPSPATVARPLSLPSAQPPAQAEHHQADRS